MDEAHELRRLLREIDNQRRPKHSKRNTAWSDDLHASSGSRSFEGQELPRLGNAVQFLLVLLRNWLNLFQFLYLLIQFSVLFHSLDSGIESFSKLGDSIYFEERGSMPSLYVIQYVSSSLNWKSGDVSVNQTVESPSSWDPYLRVALTFSPFKVVACLFNDGV